MSLRIVNSKNSITSNWKGGSTTQLFIYPPEASLIERDFDFRISSAKIDAEFSEFTAFLGYKRKLMVLEGTLELQHTNHHQILLNQFEQDQFLGDWNTVSFGKAIDFNVIFKPDLLVDISCLTIKSGDQIEFPASKFLFVYLWKGSGLLLGVNDLIVQQGDFISIIEHDALSFESKDTCVLIITTINK